MRAAALALVAADGATSGAAAAGGLLVPRRAGTGGAGGSSCVAGCGLQPAGAGDHPDQSGTAEDGALAAFSAIAGLPGFVQPNTIACVLAAVHQQAGAASAAGARQECH